MGISREEALDCFRSDDLIGLGMEADAIRRKLHPEDVVTYAIAGSIDCNAPEETIHDKINKIAEDNCAAIAFRNTAPPRTIAWFEHLFQTAKKRFPSLTLEISAAEIAEIKRFADLSIADTIARLHHAGLDSISGDSAAIQSQDWLAVHAAAHALGLQTTANMVTGCGETKEQRIGHLEAIRQLQEKTGGFSAFNPQLNTPLGPEQPTAVERLKTLAISRIFLDNIENIQCTPDANDLKSLQVSLRFGANDLGNLFQTQDTMNATEEKLRHIIRDAGFRPVQRDAMFRTLFLTG